MDDNNARPLVTFALFAYNQERFIREAVEGALAQTYSPLQIILSDDCSSDHSFDIMREMASSYHGPHEVVLNRNSANLGVGCHINRIVEIANGELIVGAAGDDVSEPHRAERICSAWLASRGGAHSIYSSVTVIDEKSRSLGVQGKYNAALASPKRIAQTRATPHGASHAFSRQVMKTFGPLAREVICEDQVIGFRASLLGTVCHLEEPLVRYRLHVDSISGSGEMDRRIGSSELRIRMHKYASQGAIVATQQIADAMKVSKVDRELISVLEQVRSVASYAAVVLDPSTTWSERFSAAASAHNKKAPAHEILKTLLKVVVWPLYARYYDVRRRASAKTKSAR